MGQTQTNPSARQHTNDHTGNTSRRFFRSSNSSHNLHVLSFKDRDDKQQGREQQLSLAAVPKPKRSSLASTLSSFSRKSRSSQHNASLDNEISNSLETSMTSATGVNGSFSGKNTQIPMKNSENKKTFETVGNRLNSDVFENHSGRNSASLRLPSNCDTASNNSSQANSNHKEQNLVDHYSNSKNLTLPRESSICSGNNNKSTTPEAHKNSTFEPKAPQHEAVINRLHRSTSCHVRLPQLGFEDFEKSKKEDLIRDANAKLAKQIVKTEHGTYRNPMPVDFPSLPGQVPNSYSVVLQKCHENCHNGIEPLLNPC